MTSAVELKDVDIVFGREVKRSLALIDRGASRDEILAETGAVLGAAGVSLAVPVGAICVLMGLSGSGKSTVLRAVNGLNQVARGQVLVAHEGRQVDVARCDEATLRAVRTRSVTMVFQQFALLPWRTVRENVGVGLARAFATEADILLMDEPFSALDPLIRDKLQDELLQLQAQLKKTILFVSHDLDEALKLGSTIAIMEGGRIVQAGTGEDILLRPADAYVAEFVKHMNPLNVLRGSALMRPAASLPRSDGAVLLDPDGRVRVSLDQEDRPVACTLDGRHGRLTACDPETGVVEQEGADLIVAPLDLRLRAAIALKRQTDNPILLVDQLGRLAGLCDDEDIYRGLLRREAA